MKPWLAAHLRLLEQLPRRTHYRHYGEEPNQGRRYGDVIPQALIDEYKRLKAGGMGYTDMLHTLSIGARTMRRISLLLQATNDARIAEHV